MNDFHILSICIEKKDKHGAMMVFRNKSEFAARKILEKIKVRNIPGTGRIFWHNVQCWLLSVCKPENKQTKSGGTGFAQRYRVVSHTDRPCQHNARDNFRTAGVCAWPDGFPPVQAYIDDERTTFTRSSSGGERNVCGYAVSSFSHLYYC